MASSAQLKHVGIEHGGMWLEGDTRGGGRKMVAEGGTVVAALFFRGHWCSSSGAAVGSEVARFRAP